MKSKAIYLLAVLACASLATARSIVDLEAESKMALQAPKAAAIPMTTVTTSYNGLYYVNMTIGS
jgi:hypothetical protein